jgi:hypothetical protein
MATLLKNPAVRCVVSAVPHRTPSTQHNADQNRGYRNPYGYCLASLQKDLLSLYQSNANVAAKTCECVLRESVFL